MTTFTLILEACAPESLPLIWYGPDCTTDGGVTFHLIEAPCDTGRFDSVELRSKSRAAIMKAVKQFWGDDDPEWFYELPFQMYTHKQETAPE